MKLFLLFALSLFLFACNSITTSDKNDSVIDTSKQITANTDTFFEDNEPYPGNTEATQLIQNEAVGKLKLGLNYKNAISAIGNPDYKSAATIWEADGLYHQDWKYDSGIDLDMAGKDSLTMEIYSLRFFAPCTLKTSRNIGVGSSMKEVKEAYKEELAENIGDEPTLIAGSIYGGIIFNFENGKLSSVFIGAAAE